MNRKRVAKKGLLLLIAVRQAKPGPPPVRSGSVPARGVSRPRLVVWGPDPKRHGGAAAPPKPPTRTYATLSHVRVGVSGAELTREGAPDPNKRQSAEITPQFG